MKILKNKKTRILLIALLLIVIAAVILYLIFGRGKYAREYGNDGLERKPVADVVSEAKNVLGNTYENFTLPDDFEIICGDKLYDITSYEDNEGLDRKKACYDWARLYIGESFDESLAEECLDSDVQHYHSIYYDNGYYLFFVKPDGYRDCLLTGWDIRGFDLYNPKVYILGKDSIDGISYNLSGEQYSISDAIDFTLEKFESEYQSLYKGCDGIVPRAVYVFTSEEGESYYTIDCEAIYKGTLVMMDGDYANMDSDGMFGYTFQFTLYEPSVLAEVAMYLPHPNEEREIKEIITLESALDHLENTLAPNSNYEISDIGLKYSKYCKDVFQTVSNIRPYWCFTIGVGASQSGMYSPKKVIYVDAQSGDIYCYNSITETMDFKYLMEEKE